MRKQLARLLFSWPAIFGALALGVAMMGASWAAVTSTPVFVQTPKYPKVQLTNANGTTAQTLYACATNGTKVIGMYATSTDTSARDVQISVLKSATTYILTTVTVAIGAGTVAGTPAVNLMNSSVWPGLPTDSDGNPFFYCETGDTLQAGMVVTLTSAKLMSVNVVAADF